MSPNNRPGFRGRREVGGDLHKINRNIRVPEVRLIREDGESDIVPIGKAYELAEQAGLDLVEIAPNAKPPVCKIVDYSKFKYDQKKKQKEIKAKTVKVTVKEIRFGPNTDEHDFQFKLKHAISFLEEGSKVKAYVHFVGRTIVYKERGEALLLRFAESLMDNGKIEQLPKLEGKRMFLYIAPKAVKKPK